MLKKQGYRGELKLHERERLSDRPFGEHSRKGKFTFEIEKVPFYNVPDLSGFKLKPYVPHTTPKIEDERQVERLVELNESMLSNIEKQVKEASKGRLEKVDQRKKMDRK